MSKDGYDRFSKLTFDKFRELAASDELSRHEKVGFPDDYREGREEAIFQDISAKLRLDQDRNRNVAEIGPGCSRLPLMLAELCRRQDHRLFLVDSREMLDQLPAEPFMEKVEGRFPFVPAFLEQHAGNIDMLLAYSVIQYPFEEGGFWSFFDQALLLIKEGGLFLIGDIPNVSMRKRFFSSPAGHRQHRAFTGRDEQPGIQFNIPEPACIDDSVVLALLSRARAAGFHGWVMPQAEGLPMANRREDILICKP